jgi:hypothetical protein
MMSNYSVKEDTNGNAVECVEVSYLPKNAVSLDGNNVNVNLRKRDEETRKLFGWHPCDLTGEGIIPDVATLSKVDGVWQGALVPGPASRKVTFLQFRKRVKDAGVNMGSLWTLAQTDGNLMDFLVASQNTSDRMVDLDDNDTIEGLAYIESGSLAGASAGFSDAVRA